MDQQKKKTRQFEDITVSPNNIRIKDGYNYGKKCFSIILYYLDEGHPECEVFSHRTMKSMCREWATHNALYRLGIAREHTKDVDINWPQSGFVLKVYNIVGAIVWPFIK